jgi:hypothetical protein
MRLESEGIDELGRGIFHVALCTGLANRRTYICVYALWERVGVWGQENENEKNHVV